MEFEVFKINFKLTYVFCQKNFVECSPSSFIRSLNVLNWKLIGENHVEIKVSIYKIEQKGLEKRQLRM